MDMSISEEREDIKALQSLLEKNYDAEEGFKEVLQKAKNPKLKDWLLQKAAQRAKFVTEIDYELRALNITPKAFGSLKAMGHRMWIDIKTTLLSNTDEIILQECLRGEEASYKEYKDQIQKLAKTEKYYDKIQNQITEIETSLYTIKTLDDIV